MSHHTHATGLLKSYSKFTFVASFKANPEIWSKFKAETKLRGVDICYVMEALMVAWMEGQKAEATVIRPVTINLTMEHVVQRPRRAQSFEAMIWESRHKNWPPPCQKADDFLKGSKEVGCLETKRWLSLAECWRCYMAGQRI